MKTLRQLNEGINCDAIFQEEVFGWISGENDTGKEEEIRDHLDDFIMQNRASTGIVKSLKTLLKCRARYKGTLIPTPKSKFAYRGMGNFINTVEYVNNNELTLMKSNPMYLISEPIPYKPHRPIQSFTSSAEVAEDFGYRGTFIKTKVTKDMIFSDAFITWFEKEVGMDVEHEILRVSKKPIKARVIISELNYNMYFK